jgi:predicted enzyme related to lactoylglutathione lyase
MSERDHYPPGVPCWVETLQADAQAAMNFYASVFGWEFEGPAPINSESAGEYYVARVDGADVAGIGRLASSGAPRTPQWTTYVRVDSVAAAAPQAVQAGGNILVAPLDAPPAGSLAILADPAGVPFGIWEPQERQGAQRVDEASAWSLSTLNTNDPAGAKEFYGTLFGWQTEPFGTSGFEMFRLPGYFGGQPLQPVARDTVAGLIPMDPDGPEGSGRPQRPRWDVDFWIDGVDDAAERARACGGTVLAAPFDQGNFRTAVLADPAGASFSISQLMIDSAT